MPVEADPGHPDAAELQVDVGTLRHRSETAAPGREHLVVPVGEGANPVEAAEVVEDDRQVGHRPGEVRQLGQLREAHPGVEGQPHPRQHPGTGAVFGGGQDPLGFPVADFGMAVPGDRVPDAVKPVWAGGLQRLQHRLHPVSQLQIGVADDRRCGAAGAIEAAGAGRGQPLDELDLANGAQLRRPVGPVHRPCLDKHRRAHGMAAADVGHQLVQQIALVGNPVGSQVPEMMMGITDRDLRLQHRFLGQPSQSFPPYGMMAPPLCGSPGMGGQTSNGDYCRISCCRKGIDGRRLFPTVSTRLPGEEAPVAGEEAPAAGER